MLGSKQDIYFSVLFLLSYSNVTEDTVAIKQFFPPEYLILKPQLEHFFQRLRLFLDCSCVISSFFNYFCLFQIWFAKMSLSVQYVKYVVSKRENPVLMPEEWLNDWRLRLFQAAKPEKGDNRFYTHNNDVRLCMFGTPENFVQWNNMKSFVCLLRGGTIKEHQVKSMSAFALLSGGLKTSTHTRR